MNNDKLYATAFIKIHMGQVDEAFDTFEKLMDEKYGILIYMKVQHNFFPQMVGERYTQLVERLGF